MENRKTIYLVDGTAYIYRAYHAIRNLANSQGLPTNATFGFTQMLIKLLNDKKPEYTAIFFDAKGPTFRHEIYTQYKANRPPMPEDLIPQLSYIREIVSGFNLEGIELAGFEADDLIGTLARQAETAGFSVVMVTGDKDFMQLVTDNAVIWDPMKDKQIDSAHIKAEFGVSPSQMVDIMGLAGDSADNIPGVPGIGMKTAAALIQSYGSIDGVYSEIDSLTKKKQRENLITYKEQAMLSRDLVRIRTEAPLSFDPEAYRTRAVDKTRLKALFGELEFRQLLKTVTDTRKQVEKKYQAVFDLSTLEKLVRTLSNAGVFAIDTETTALNPMLADLVGISVSCEADEAFYIPVGHTGDAAQGQLPLADVKACLEPLLADETIRKVGQNIKYDWIVMARHGFELKGVAFDTMVASYLLNPSKRTHGLDQIALEHLDHKMIAYEAVAGKGKNAICFSEVPLEKAVPYACEDADMTLQAYHLFMPQLEENGLTSLLESVEMPLIPVLMKMEMAGICVDREKLQALSAQFARRLAETEAAIYELAGEEFNINSPQQLGRILFEKLGLPVQKKTKKKTGYSTDVEVLNLLSDHHELPAMVLKHRTVAKLKSTYADALIELINPQTNRIHSSFNQTVTATGRLSSSDPNLQNIPIRDDDGRAIREAFVPREGWRLLAADYSQIELRILAHCADDDILIEAFNNDEDIHTRTASEVFEMLPAFITPDVRRQAKAINFGIIYGMSPFGLSKSLGISQKMAKTYIDHYFKRYKGVKKFIDQTIVETRASGKTATLLGRVRHLPDINSKNKTLKQFAERIAINTPIQGTAADLIKLAMIQVDAAFKKSGLRSVMLLSVHDELVFESPPEEMETAKKLVKEVMESVWPLSVPLKVNIAEGENWAQAH